MKAWTTFYMQGALERTRGDLEGRILAGRFKPIDLEAGKSRSAGWAYHDDNEALGEVLDVDRVFLDPFVALALRVDEIKVPSGAIRRETDKRAKEELRRQGGEKLSRDVTSAIKAEVLRELRARAIPETTCVQVRVDEEARRVYVGSCPAGIRETVEERLKDLGYELVIQSPFAAAALEGPRGPVDIAARRIGSLEFCPYVEV